MRLTTYAAGLVLALMLLVGPADKADAEELLASWYGLGFEGNLMASGDVFEPYNEFTAASAYLPFGTVLTVCYDGCVEVVITDRGPYVGGRSLDLSAIATEEIGLTYVGVDVVEVYSSVSTS